MANPTAHALQPAGDTAPPRSLAPDRYLQPHQARYRPSTSYEDLLGDAIERAFAGGAHALAALVESLNRQGMTTRAGQPWTEENYAPEMAALSR